MKLVSIDVNPATRTGVMIGSDVLDFALAGEVLPLAGWVPASMPSLLAGGGAGLDLIRRMIDQVQEGRSDEGAKLRKRGALRPVGEVKLASPVPQPGILLSHGRAYGAHKEEMIKNLKLLDSDLNPEEPKAFLKNVHGIVGTNTPVVLPPHFANAVDFECEFSIVFGADCFNVTPEEALGRVAGYTMINDVSARDSSPPPVSGQPLEWDLIRMGKQMPTFSPVGPVIVTKDEVPDPHDVHIGTKLNGEVMQAAYTGDLLWSIPFLISYFSRFYPFKAGDILTTGSPSGVGHGRVPPVYMKDGDVVTVWADHVGELRNPIVSADKA